MDMSECKFRLIQFDSWLMAGQLFHSAPLYEHCLRIFDHPPRSVWPSDIRLNIIPHLVKMTSPVNHFSNRYSKHTKPDVPAARRSIRYSQIVS